MAANKEAIAIVLDVGPSMNQAPPGEATSLQTSIDAMTMIIQRKVFAESKDLLSLVLFGTEDTDNPLSDGQSYENVTIARPLGEANFDFLEQIQNDIKTTNVSADFVDALVVAMDHLVNATQGVKGIGSKRIILLTDLGGEFADDQIDTIVKGIKGTGTELNVIGPNLEDDDDSQQPGPSGASNSHRKQKTPQQRAGEAMLQHILQEVEGECYSFSEALPALSNFQMRQIKQVAWKCDLEITSNLHIPINSFAKIKDFKLKQSWKRVYAKDPSEEVGTLRTYHKNDEEETEVDPEDRVEGHRYGNTIVVMSEDDKENMKYRAAKCFKVLGFTKAECVKRHHYLGDGSSVVVADKGDEAAGVALSSLISALYETNMVAIVRKVYSAASGPKLGCLVPHIKTDYECLIYVELPFMEDVRQFTFGSLPVSEETTSVSNQKFAPSAQQLSAMDKLIHSMDLTQAEEGEDDEPYESMKPKNTFNPHFQRLYQCLQHRGLNPDDPLPELSPMIEATLHPPQEVQVNADDKLEEMKKLFKLEVVKRKEEKTGENLFKEEAADGESKAKKSRLDDNLEGGMEDITRAKVTKVGTVTPVEDFIAIISNKEDDKFEEASIQMQKRIEQIIMDSFGSQFYAKAMECLKALRLHSVKMSEPGIYNTFMKAFKDTLIGKGRRDFWEQVIEEKQGLVSKVESEDSNVTLEEAKLFVKEEEEEKEETMATADEGEDADDLLAGM